MEYLAQNPYWTRAFSRQKEILAYLQTAASKFGVYPHIKFGKTVKRSWWDQKTAKWTVETTEGDQFTGNVLISGVGGLHVPKFPNFPGTDQFEGQAFHTNAWPSGFKPQGQRIAVIGTGASAVQTVPSVAEMAPSKLTVFQRTPCWSPPRLDFPYPEWAKTVFALVPLAGTLYRWFFFWRNEFRFRVLFTSSSWITKRMSTGVHELVRKYIEATVKDPELAAKLTPDYAMGCKRITPSDTYLAAYNKDFVHLVTSKIECATKRGIRTADGVEHEFDTIIFATGFDLEKSAKAFSQEGLKGSLEEDYGDAPSAFLGVTHPNHPNFFSLLGPGTGLGHNSIIFMIECQVNYTADTIVKMIKAGAKSIVVKPEVFRNYLDFVQENMEGKVFADNAQCTGWYRNARGVNWTLWPLDLVSYWWYTRACTTHHYSMQF